MLRTVVGSGWAVVGFSIMLVVLGALASVVGRCLLLCCCCVVVVVDVVVGAVHLSQQTKQQREH